jgi:chaperonin GroES
MTKIKPLGNRVLIKRSEAERSRGGIILPDTAQEKPRIGEVIAVGPGKRTDDGTLKPIEISVGNQVLFSSYAGTEISEEEDQYLIMSEDDILGVLTQA